MKGQSKPKVISISEQELNDIVDEEAAFLRGVEDEGTVLCFGCVC